MESYCGKNCVQCSYLNQGRCPGCKDGPGMPYTRACPLARCCQQKGHRGCYTCLFAENCHLLRQKDSLPSWRPTGTASLKISSPTPPPAKEQAELLLRGFCLLSLLEFLSFGWFFLISPILSHSLSRGMLVSLAALSTLFFSLAYFYLNRAHTGYYIPGSGPLCLLPIALAAIYMAGLESGQNSVASMMLVYMLLFCLAEWAACFFHRSVAASLSPSLAKRWAILYCFLPFLVFFSSIAYMSYLVDHQIPAPILLPLLLCLVLMKVLKLIFLIQTAVTLGRYLGGMKNGPQAP
ncbi:DUF3795 domain-containing protein [Angelakisella massiliensis]|uniref:DUF3795 domain-containing protein n=1 Tax=Angelakisella massiliensis TaxID=1871018 RepID=UPI0008F89FA6|nr:DUF3795 domain-containing protein [Angelakisella massiliensis]